MYDAALATPESVARMPRFEVVVHRTLQAAEAAWRSLQSNGTASAYQTWDWSSAIGKHLLGPAKAVPILVELNDADTGETLMLMPLQRRRRFGLSVIQPLGAGVVDYTAPLLATSLVADIAGNPAIAHRACAAMLASLPRADLLELGQIPGTIAMGGARIANPLAAIAGIRPSPVSASGVRIDGEPDTLLRRLCSSQTVRSIASSRRKLEKSGEFRFVIARDQAERDAMLDALMAQRRARFQELGRFDLIRRGEVERFYREAAGSELVQVSGISVGGEWIAMAYGLVHDGAFHGIILAIGAASWRPFSPGMLMIAELLRSSRAAGLRYFDFTVGAMAYKARFSAEPLPLWELVVPRSMLGRLWRVGDRAVGAARARLQGNERLHAALQRARRAVRKMSK